MLKEYEYVKYIIVKTDFEDIHKWDKAPEEVAFLKNPHRHKFYVEVKIQITQDRELEYFMVKRYLDNKILPRVKELEINKSCEKMAEYILEQIIEKYCINYGTVKVFEDNENGSEVKYKCVNIFKK